MYKYLNLIFFRFFILWAQVFCQHVCLCATHMPGAFGSQKMGNRSLGMGATGGCEF